LADLAAAGPVAKADLADREAAIPMIRVVVEHLLLPIKAEHPDKTDRRVRDVSYHNPCCGISSPVPQHFLSPVVACNYHFRHLCL